MSENLSQLEEESINDIEELKYETEMNDISNSNVIPDNEPVLEKMINIMSDANDSESIDEHSDEVSHSFNDQDSEPCTIESKDKGTQENADIWVPQKTLMKNDYPQLVSSTMESKNVQSLKCYSAKSSEIASISNNDSSGLNMDVSPQIVNSDSSDLTKRMKPERSINQVKPETGQIILTAHHSAPALSEFKKDFAPSRVKSETLISNSTGTQNSVHTETINKSTSDKDSKKSLSTTTTQSNVPQPITSVKVMSIPKSPSFKSYMDSHIQEAPTNKNINLESYIPALDRSRIQRRSSETISEFRYKSLIERFPVIFQESSESKTFIPILEVKIKDQIVEMSPEVEHIAENTDIAEITDHVNEPINLEETESQKQVKKIRRINEIKPGKRMTVLSKSGMVMEIQNDEKLKNDGMQYSLDAVLSTKINLLKNRKINHISGPILPSLEKRPVISHLKNNLTNPAQKTNSTLIASQTHPLSLSDKSTYVIPPPIIQTKRFERTNKLRQLRESLIQKEYLGKGCILSNTFLKERIGLIKDGGYHVNVKPQRKKKGCGVILVATSQMLIPSFNSRASPHNLFSVLGRVNWKDNTQKNDNETKMIYMQEID
ncbi:hypothetical protein HK098_003133 [Nowakowskiella sp. JEL0407]|nr:hypothetical protein HK098_003133 [Nowakowskiella sp. JEL0407]